MSVCPCVTLAVSGVRDRTLYVFNMYEYSTVQHSTEYVGQNQFFAPCLFCKPLFAVVTDGQKVRIRASTDGHNKGALGLPVLEIIKTKFGIGITKSIICSSLTKKIFFFSIFNFLNIYITKQDPRYLLLFFHLNVQLQLNYQKNLKLECLFHSQKNSSNHQF